MISTIGQALEWHAADKPQKTAVVDGERRTSYAEFWDRVRRLANGLHSLGLGSGDRIGILSLNCQEYLETYHAIALLGAAAVPMNFRYTPDEIEYVLTQSESRAVICQSEFTGVLSTLRAKLPAIDDRFVVIGSDVPSDMQSYNEVLEKAVAEAPPVTVDPSACFFQGYTAGTTGFPKGCVNPHDGFVDFFKRTAILYQVSEADTQIVPAPLFHEAPTLFALTQMFVGGTVVTTADPSAPSLFRLIETERPTWGFLVPTMWQSLVAAEDRGNYDVSSMRLLVSAGQPLLTHTKEGLLELFPSGGLNEFYGGTEVGIVTNLGPEDQRRKVRSVGRPVFGYHVRLRDTEGNDVPTGEVGEIYIRGPIFLREYYRNPEATEKAFDGEWITLGDMGRFDDEGYLHIVDRKNDMVITGGENVFPNEVEAPLHQHPDVEGVVVIGVPDQKWGEALKAVVVRRPGSDLTEADVLAYAAEHIADYKRPKSVDFVDELPMSSFGKILRREVRAPYWEDADGAV